MSLGGSPWRMDKPGAATSRNRDDDGFPNRKNQMRGTGHGQSGALGFSDWNNRHHHSSGTWQLWVRPSPMPRDTCCLLVRALVVNVRRWRRVTLNPAFINVSHPKLFFILKE